MRFLFSLLLLGLLAACASLKDGADGPRAQGSVQPPSDAVLATPAPAPAPAHRPQYPQGPLRALDAGSVDGDVTRVAALQPPQDLWQRLRQGFAMPDLDEDLVRERERWYTAHPDYFQRMVERGGKYLFHIVEELEQRGMPTELAFVPYIESAFNPEALSRAKALGLWQFIPATGKHYQLQQNAFRDDRKDVLKSTRAALDYMQQLHTLFGDWHLVLAAYNWGEGSVGRAIARNEKEGLPGRYTDLRMPAETRHYVPKLQAVKNIIARPQDFGLALPPLENHPYFREVPVQGDIDTDLAAALAGVSAEDFRALNPSFERPVIFAATGAHILLPWEQAPAFESQLKAWQQSGRALSSWSVWTAPATMSAQEAARRLQWDETDLRRVNRIAPGMRIQAGSALLVPRSPGAGDVAAHVADNATLRLLPATASGASSGQRQIKVRKGDTLFALARHHGVKVSSLAQWNRIGPNAVLRIGQTLLVQAPKAAAGARSVRTASSKKAGAKKPAGKKAKKTAARKARKPAQASTKLARSSQKP